MMTLPCFGRARSTMLPLLCASALFACSNSSDPESDGADSSLGEADSAASSGDGDAAASADAVATAASDSAVSDSGGSMPTDAGGTMPLDGGRVTPSEGGAREGGAREGGASEGGAGEGGAGEGDGGVKPDDAGTGGCTIPTYDPSRPPAPLALSGNLGTHDPVVIFADGVYYQFATGNGIGAKTSRNLLAWTAVPDVFSSIPSWVSGKLSGVTNIWAPDISYFGGSYHLYYSVSTFGSNKSCIGHATRTSLASGSWTDHGAVICSNVGTTDNFNAIDANVILDEGGTPWLSFGSFWSGIKLVKLDASGARSGTEMHALARHSSIEGPFIVRACGYYYLFVSFGACCGDPYDYNIRVGRSRSVTGPYLDKAG
jgi:arabinan endo-1,5-alpha-L-arabinosidase